MMLRGALMALAVALSTGAQAQQLDSPESTLFIGLGANGEVEVASTPFQGARPLDLGRASWLDAAPSRAVQAPAAVATAAQGRALPLSSRDPSINTAIKRAAEQHGVDANLLHAVIKVESNYRQRAVSRAGAAGLMQLMPATAKRFGVSDRFNIEQNISGGAAYLKWLAQRFSGDLDLMLAAYNAGEGAVHKHGNRIPPYKETRAYVSKVRAHYVATGY